MNAQELADFIRQHPEQAQRFGGDFMHTLVFRASARREAKLPPLPGDAALLRTVNHSTHEETAHE